MEREYAEQKNSLAGGKVAVSKGRIDNIIDEQGRTLDLISVLRLRLATVTESLPDTDKASVGYTHINAIAEQQVNINYELNSLIESIVL